MVISTHLPPPVMIDSTAERAWVTHMLCCSCAMCFSAAASSENDQGSMNLASNTAPVPSTMPSRVAAIQEMAECLTRRWTSVTLPAGVALVPGPVEVLGRGAELHDQVAGQVLRLGLAALLPPEADQGGLVAPHDDPGVGAADEGAAVDALDCRWRSCESRHRSMSPFLIGVSVTVRGKLNDRISITYAT